MTVRLTVDRVEELLKCCILIQNKHSCSIRQFARLIRKIVASEPGVEYTPLYYKPLERVKDHQFQISEENFDRFIKVSPEIKSRIQSWINSLPNAFRMVIRGLPQLLIYTDASLQGWGLQ